MRTMCSNLAKAFQTSAFESFWTMNDETTGLFERLKHAGPGIGTDMVEAQLAWIEGTRERRYDRSVARWNAIESADPFTLYLRFLISPFARAATAAENRLEVARSEFGEGIEWARSIGARSFESALLSQAALAERVFGHDSQTTHDLACEAAELAAKTHMRHLEWRAILCRADAVLLGASSPYDPLVDTLNARRAAIRSGAEVRLAMGLNTAVRLLVAADRMDAAALAAIGAEPAGDSPRRLLRLLPREALDDARAQVEGGGVQLSGIARSTVAELEQLVGTR